MRLEQLGDIVHVDLPEKEASLEKGASLGTVESTKTVSDIYIPASGRVVDVNAAVVSEPEVIMRDPYDSGWLISIELSETIEEGLMDASEYEKYVKESEA